jgi:hypothetical protein
MRQCFGSIGIHLIGILIQSGFRVLMTKIWKNLQLKKNWIKNYNYLSLGLNKGRPSYNHQKGNIKHFKTWNFIYPIFFLFLWVILALLWSGSWFRFRKRIHWPDRIRIQSGSGSWSKTLADEEPNFWIRVQFRSVIRYTLTLMCVMSGLSISRLMAAWMEPARPPK